MLSEADLRRRGVDHRHDADFLYHAAEFYLALAEQGVLEPTRDQLGRLRRRAISMADVHKLFNMEATAARKHEHVTYWYKKAHGATTEQDDKAYQHAYNKFKRPDEGPAPKFPGSHANVRQMGYISPALAEIFRYVIEAKKSWDNAQHVLETEAMLQQRRHREAAPSPSPGPPVDDQNVKPDDQTTPAKRARRDEGEDTPACRDEGDDTPAKRVQHETKREDKRRGVVLSPEKKTQIHTAMQSL